VFGYDEVKPGDADLTKQHAGDPIGERIILSGRVLDENGRPVPHTLVEIWQANSAGRYPHRVDQHDAPTDPNFTGCGRTLTDDKGNYRFVSIKPGEYPWRNHHNAWRPAHIHFSLFGPSFLTRLVTQMYFPGDPLNAQDRILNAVPDAKARERLIARLVPPTGDPHNALVFEHQIVLRGRRATPAQP
jgi:protocatechuate 3,4-dioxygenase beta subunit